MPLYLEAGCFSGYSICHKGQLTDQIAYEYIVCVFDESIYLFLIALCTRVRVIMHRCTCFCTQCVCLSLSCYVH